MNTMQVTDNRSLTGIEIAAMRSLFALATPSECEALGLYCEEHGSSLVTACAASTSVVLNHVIGFTAPDADRLDEILSVYRDRRIMRAFICVDEADQPAVDALAERGFAEGRAWHKFTRSVGAVRAPVSTSLTVKRADRQSGMDFGRIVAAAFDMPAAVAPVLARLTAVNEWSVFMAFNETTPAGAGGLFVQDAIGYLTFGATAPAFRSRGCQGAIMEARIRHAELIGTRLLVAETGEAVPGDPQHSWRNIERAGFSPAYRIRNFAIPSP